MEDDDDDTVVGTCLHCNAPPPPRSSSERCTFSVSGGGGGPCSASSITATASTATSPSAATRVQVSCDDCRSFICDGCHWCHEFQANHEIRVCDRCDAFYCRGCDEMDQCEDCSEVVCNTCSTLMSCKFCGCGLCEDCATACGRCGIVLCARDAKFAVECDTCRMSYCLVCLASGTKDPCVRCGHRPSKRVEQLVHLRLKSIYKAFKQSGASSGPSSGNGGGSVSNSGSLGNCKGDGSGRDTSNMGGKYSSALRSLTDNSSDSSKDSFSNFDQSMASEVAAVLQTASNSMSGSDGGDYSDGQSSRRTRGKRISGHDHSPSPGGSRNRASARASNAAAERYFRKNQAELEAAAAAAEAEAEAAAAALLAELDEEKASSNAGASKKSKKKKKKKEKRKEAAAVEQHVTSQSPPATDNVKSADKSEKAPSTPKKKGTKKAPPKSPIDDESSDEEMNFEQLVAGTKGGTRTSKKEKKEENSLETAAVAPPKPKPEHQAPVIEVAAAATSAATTADFDAELAILLSNEDEEGLQTFLANLKGVPGLGAARKTAKKALKRIKEARQPAVTPEEETESQVQSSGNVDAETKPAIRATGPKQGSRVSSSMATTAIASSTGTQHEPLLRVVSRTQSNVGGTSSRGGSSSTSIPASARAECVMHMSPAVVGWVIGKGGSRIRDMMEESGAKIWIDQESMGAKESRVVYVSGKRSSVDSAVRMVKDLVAKAPVAASAAASQGVAPAPAPPPAKPAPSSAPAPVAPKPAAVKNLPSVVEVAAKKEPSSFAAAISSGSPSPAAVTPPGPTPVVPPQQSAVKQGWALPEGSASGQNAPAAPLPQAAPRAAMAAPPNSTMTSGFDAAGTANLFSDTVTSEFTCDPRFVALLIGRRGWTVKNIQTESGADLRIDQSIDPPKIIISGNAENVNKAKHLVCEVLKYPQAQLHQEAMAPENNGNMGMTANSVRPEHNPNGNSMRMMPTSSKAATSLSTMPLPTSLHRDVSSSSTPNMMGELHLQQEPLRQNHTVQSSQGAMNFLPGYVHQQQNQRNLGMFQDSSPAANRIVDFLPNDGRQPLAQSVNVNPSTARAQSQDWGGHHGQEAPMQTQYSTLPPFSGDQYLMSNPNVPSLARQQSAPDDVSHRRPSSTSFALPPAPPSDQHLQFAQNNGPSHRMPQPPAQAPSSSRGNDYMGNAGNLNQNMNGWDLPNGKSMGGETWNQGSHAPPQQPVFQAQAAPSPLPDNPFQNQAQTHHAPAAISSQPISQHRVSDDSLMVDNLFASMGSPGSDGDGLLNALNSVSIGEGTAPQQQANWGSNIAGWSGEDSSGSSLLHQSRLGDYSG